MLAAAPARRIDEALRLVGMQGDMQWTAATSRDEEVQLHAAANVAAHVLEDAEPTEILRWAADTIDNFVVTSSFGIDAAVLTHMVATVAPATPIVFLDTGLHFPETIAHRDELVDLLDLNVVNVRSSLSVEDQAALHGARLFARDAETCCMLRKGLPLQTALSSANGWATGIRRTQTPARATTPVVGVAHKGDRMLLKVAPLATWTDEQMAAYRAAHDLPSHQLEARGYTSVGCEPCTRPTRPGEGPRAGRWEGDPDRDECGIHVDPVLGLVRTRTMAQAGGQP